LTASFGFHYHLALTFKQSLLRWLRIAAMPDLKLALCFDSQEEHLAAGLSAEMVADLDSEETIDLVGSALRRLGHQVELVRGGDRLASRLAAGQRWDLVFNMAEGLYGRCREARVPAVCELFDQAVTFSDALTCGLTLDKEMAKRVVRDGGVPTPSFAVVDEADELAAGKESFDLEPPVFVKPSAEGNSKGVTRHSLATSKEEVRAAVRRLLAVYRQPVLIEEFLPGCEVTVGIVGNGRAARVIGVMEIDYSGAVETIGYTTINKRERKERLRFRLSDDSGLVAASSALAVAAYRVLRCRDAARIDLRCDRHGRPMFLEANALPGLHPTHSDLPRLAALAGLSYPALLAQIVDAAAPRIRRPASPGGQRDA